MNPIVRRRWGLGATLRPATMSLVPVGEEAR
jgi:hypothetical protein